MSDAQKQSLLLTRRQRDYLRGELEVSDDHRRSIKSKIRDRIEGSLEDFLLLDGMAQDDTLRDRISDSETLMPLLKFAFLTVDLDKQVFEDLIADAIVQAHFVAPKGSGMSVINADVDIEIETQYDPALLLRKYQAGDELTPEEIGILVTAAGSEGLDLDNLADQSTMSDLHGAIIEAGED